MSGGTMGAKQLCVGTGKPGARGRYPYYPSCPECWREFSAQGRKAQARLGDPWKSIPRHFVEVLPVPAANEGELARCDICGSDDGRMSDFDIYRDDDNYIWMAHQRCIEAS